MAEQRHGGPELAGDGDGGEEEGEDDGADEGDERYLYQYVRTNVTPASNRVTASLSS